MGWAPGSDGHPFESLTLAEHPGPPHPKHVRVLRACAGCGDGLPKKHRCTKLDQFHALTFASDDDLRYCRVDGCILDLDEELDRRERQGRYESPLPSLPRLPARLFQFLKGIA